MMPGAPPQRVCIIMMDPALKRARFEKSFAGTGAEITFKMWSDADLLSYIKTASIDAIIISGSRYRIRDTATVPTTPTLPRKILRLGIPVLGICYGFQWIATALCPPAPRKARRCVETFADGRLHEYARTLAIQEPAAPFHVSVGNVATKLKYHFTHHDYISQVPPNWTVDIRHNDEIWMAHHDKIMGIQFHPEYYKESRVFYAAWLRFVATKKN